MTTRQIVEGTGTIQLLIRDVNSGDIIGKRFKIVFGTTLDSKKDLIPMTFLDINYDNEDVRSEQIIKDIMMEIRSGGFGLLFNDKRDK